jgi:hypothetical protein
MKIDYLRLSSVLTPFSRRKRGKSVGRLHKLSPRGRLRERVKQSKVANRLGLGSPSCWVAIN